MQDQKHLDKNDSNLASQFIYKYLPYWPLFTLILLASVGSAWLYLKYTVPVYESTATILIKDENKSGEESKTVKELNPVTPQKTLENEMEIIKSRTMMANVVKNLTLYAPVFEEKDEKINEVYVNTPLKVESNSPDNITNADKIYFTIDQAAGKISINNNQYAFNEWVTTPYGVLKFTPQAKSMANGSKYYFALINPKFLATDLSSRLEIVQNSKPSTILNLKIRDIIPQRGEDILNGLVDSYNQASLNDKTTLAANTLGFVEERLKVVRKELDSIDRELQKYKSSRGAVDISSQGQMYLQSQNDLGQKAGEVNVQLAVLDQVQKYVQSKENKGGIVPSTFGINDPVLSTLVNKLYDQELQYEKLKKTTAENNPLLVSISDQIDKIKPSILENIQNQKRSLQASQNNLRSSSGNYSSMLSSIPQKEKEIIEISRRQNIESEIYSFLLQKREEAALSASSGIADSKMVDRAQSSVIPVSPNRRFIYMLSVVIGIALCIAIISGRELLNRTILYRDEIEQYTSFPIIGEIAFEKLKSAIVIGAGKVTPMAEQFRKLRASLTFLGINSKRKRILVTSSIPGEGKSFVALNLALSLSIMGKKVALVEMDLSNPSLGDKLNIHEEIGVTSYLIGESEPEEIIKRTDAHENLFYLPAGTLPNNPSELIMNGRIQHLLTYLEGMFDYIVVDSAPVGALSDAYVLSPLCNATLYIIKHKYTPKSFVQRLEKSNKVNELHNVALVFNGVHQRGFSKDSYGYGYGYGYVYNNKTKKKKVLKAK